LEPGNPSLQNNLWLQLGDDIPDGTASPYLFAVFGCGWLGEFLEARIIPERIEHGIEPKQRRSERRKLFEKFSLLFRR